MYIRGLLVGYDGTFNIDDARIDPFLLWNMEINPASLRIDKGILAIEGTIQLPYSLGYPLGGREIKLKSLQMNQNGKLLAFDAQLNAEVVYQVDANHYVISNECKFTIQDGYPCLILKNSEVRLMSTHELAYTKKVDVVFNLATGIIISPKKF